jgi:hypothetical protein
VRHDERGQATRQLFEQNDWTVFEERKVDG